MKHRFKNYNAKLEHYRRKLNMTREEAAMRLKEEVLDQLYYDRHMMTLKEIESWLYKHNCDEDALDVIMEIIED